MRKGERDGDKSRTRHGPSTRWAATGGRKPIYQGPLTREKRMTLEVREQTSAFPNSEKDSRSCKIRLHWSQRPAPWSVSFPLKTSCELEMPQRR